MEVSLLLILKLIAAVVVLIAIWHFYCRVSIPRLIINNANVLITGGSEGIGFSMAKACIKDGANVAILARNKEKLNKAAEELNKLKVNKSQEIITISADVSDYKSMESAIKSNLKWTSMDALICNAGVEQVSLFENTSLDDYHRMMNINYFGAVNAIKICLDLLKKSGSDKNCARILVNCSLLGIMSMAYYSAYCSSKWALRGFVESIYAEFAALNIYTSIVYPPDVRTSQYQREKSTKGIPKEVRELSSAADVFEPDDVGKDMMLMLKEGEYCRSWGIDGWMLMNETIGFSLPCNLLNTLSQIIGMGIFRTIAMWYIQNIYNVCKNSINNKKNK